MRRRPDRLGQVADVEAARLERLLLEHGERRHPGGERAHREARAARAAGSRCSRSPARAARASGRRARPRSRAPRTSRGRRRRSASASARSPASRRTAAASAAGSPGGHEQRVPAVGQQLAGRGRVGGDQRRRAGDRLERLVRDHAGGLGASCRRCRARSRPPGSRPAGRRTRPTAPTRRSRAGRRAEARAGRCRRRGTGSPARARPRRGSSRARAAGSACRRRARGTVSRAASPGRKSRSSAPTKHTSTRSGREAELARGRTRRGPRCRRRRRSARRNARRSTRCTTPAPGEPRRNRCRSSTSVSNSETSGLKITGRPRATRFAAGRSKWPG